MKTLRRHVTVRAAILLVGGILATSTTVGQEIDPNAVREEDLPRYWERKIAVLEYVPSPAKRARHLLDHYEIVALGEFLSISEPDARYLHARTLAATFRVEEAFRGSNGVQEVTVELMSDMLEFPGEGISRYQKRAHVREILVAEREQHVKAVQALETAKRDAAIDEAEYRRRKSALEREEREWTESATALDTRLVTVIDDKTFYDLGGVIKPHQKYLIALNKGSNVSSAYVLDERTANVFWSDTRDEIVGALRSMTRK